MNQSTDTDATGPFAVGTGRSDQSSDIRSIQPNWIADGYGVRGPQKPVTQDRATPEPISFSPDVGPRGSNAGPGQENCDPGPDADDTIKYIKATQWDSGTSKWKCVWLPTCPSLCDEA